VLGRFHLETHVPDVVSGISDAGCSAGVATLSMGSVLQHPEDISPFFSSITFSFLVCLAAAMLRHTMRDSA